MNRLLIVGFAYSGSTLLSLGLSRSPEVCALGEVPLAPFREGQLPCTCGAPFVACPVWGPYFAERAARDFALADLLREVEARVTRLEPGVGWIIDSGKTQHGGLPAHGAQKDGSVRVIHLVRHPAAVAYSCLWRGMDLEEALTLWIAMEEHLQTNLRAIRAPKRTLQFEAMTGDFGGTLSDIGRWMHVRGPLGEAREPWNLRDCSWTGRAHLMGSNTSVKFNPGPPVVIPDERFRRALPPATLAAIEARTAHLWPPRTDES